MKNTVKVSLALGAGVLAVVGAVAAPAVQTEAASVNTNVRAVVGSTITLTTTSQGTSNNVDLNLTPGSSPVLTSASDTLTVNTNSTAGYLLTLADTDTTTALTHTVTSSYTIAAQSGTTPATLAANTWGFAVPGKSYGGQPFDASYAVESNSTTSTSKWGAIPVPASPYTLKSTAATATNDQTVVWYAAKVDSSKPTGTYTDQVVYTATAN